jgi:hypothetical protein
MQRTSLMKIMAIGTLKPLTSEQQRMYMPTEVPATLQLYLDGKMEQFWLRDDNAGVIFLMNSTRSRKPTRCSKHCRSAGRTF